MEPIPETSEADAEFGPFMYHDEDLLERLLVLSEDLVEIVDDCVGMSVSLLEHEVTFTLVSSTKETALLDAVQYVDGGPCLDAMDEQQVLSSVPALMSETTWQLFAAATATAGVASTLSLPIVEEGRTIGGFNLYGSTSNTFEGQHERLADVLGAWAEGAVTNADLPFHTRELARRAPAILRDSTSLSIAAALLSRNAGLSHDEAADRLRAAAVRAAVPLTRLVDSVIDVLGSG